MSATPAQRAMIESLCTKIKVDAETLTMVRKVLIDPGASPARGGPISRIIDGLIERQNALAPAAQAPTPSFPGTGLINTLLRESNVALGTYLIKVEDLPAHLRHRYVPNSIAPEYLKVAVREFNGTRYLRYRNTMNELTRFEDKGDQELLVTRCLYDPTIRLRHAFYPQATTTAKGTRL